MMSSGMRPDEYDDPYQKLVHPSLIEAPMVPISDVLGNKPENGARNVSTTDTCTSDNGNGTNLAIIGFNSEPVKVSTAASFIIAATAFSTEMNNPTNVWGHS